MSFDLVLFALGGVLVDSERPAAEARAEALAGAGLPVSADELLEDFPGQSTKEVLLRLEKRAHAPIRATLIAEADAQVAARLSRDVKPVAGAREALAALGGRYCTVSDEPLERARAMLGAAELLPPLEGRIFAAPDLKLKPRPSTDLFRFVVEKTGVKPARCFAVEASAAGIAAAKATGMRAVGFSGASHAFPGLADRLTDAGAETVLRRLADLTGVLTALAEWSEEI
ncbi:MAG TPA: HAD-IA family hydrolase [Mesorhizobium sp.]|jgi:HAD superfamily hydrolase (TIGR01509 family)|nr:HAD-IA family hydrolase [Mesorhizobium sp.]